MSAPGFLPWLAEALMASTLLIALVLMLRRPVARYFGVRAAYALWALPVLRFALPRLPEGAAPVAALLPADTRVVTIMDMRAAVAVPVAHFPWVEAALALWIGGAVLFVVLQAVAYRRFARLMLHDGAIIRHERGITLVQSVHVSGPLAFGIRRKHVVVPIDFADRYSPREQQLALAHEYMHHRRGDLAANLVAALLLALHWCNPVAWIAYRAFRADQELACDAQVLAHHGQDHAQDYGRAILKAATARATAPTAPFAGGNRYSICHLNSVDTLKGRLKMLSTHSASLHRISWGMSAVAVVTIAGLALTASGSEAAQKMATVSRHLSDARLTRLATFLPQAPAMPLGAAAPVSPSDMDVPEAPEAPESIDAPDAPAEPAEVAEAPEAPEAPDMPDIPTAAEIAAMVPDVRVESRCDGSQDVSTRDYRDASGKQHVRVAICHSALQRKALAEAEAGLAEARSAIAQSHSITARAMAKAHAEIASARAEIRREMARARAEESRID